MEPTNEEKHRTFNKILEDEKWYYKATENRLIVLELFTEYLDTILTRKFVCPWVFYASCTHAVRSFRANEMVDSRIFELIIRCLSNRRLDFYLSTFDIARTSQPHELFIYDTLAICPARVVEAMAQLAILANISSEDARVPGIVGHVLTKYHPRVTRYMVECAISKSRYSYELVKLLTRSSGFTNESLLSAMPCKFKYDGFDYSNPLKTAIITQNDDRIFDLLLKSGYSIIDDQNEHNCTFVFVADLYRPQMIPKLLELGADIDVSMSGYTYLMYYSMLRNDEKVSIAIRCGARSYSDDGKIALVLWYMPLDLKLTDKTFVSLTNTWHGSIVNDSPTPCRAPQCLFDSTPREIVEAYLAAHPESQHFVEIALSHY